MKGSVFLGFEAYINETYGMELWQKCLDATSNNHQDVYLAAELYEDSELVALISAASKFTNTSVSHLLREFGAHFFKTLYSFVEAKLPEGLTLFEFLELVDSVIHVEVQKSDINAYTPNLFYDSPRENELSMRYSSKRNLCFFAEGLVLGAAKQFDEQVEVTQPQCIHHGDHECLLKIIKK